MLIAELRGKPSGRSSEDGLTSAVFGRLRYVPRRLVNQVLRSIGVSAPPTAMPTIDLWPNREVRHVPLASKRSRASLVEPDAVVRAGSTLLIVEAKYLSPLSGEDQLGKELLLGLHVAAREKRKSVHLLYLTPGPVEPGTPGFEVKNSALVCSPQMPLPNALRSYVTAQRKLGVAVPELAWSASWVSWGKLVRTLSEVVANADRPALVPLTQDLAELLTRRGVHTRDFAPLDTVPTPRLAQVSVGWLADNRVVTAGLRPLVRSSLNADVTQRALRRWGERLGHPETIE